ncbi:MAG TPA: hypothetical protein VIL99_00040 [Ignavibacteria bacterium]
MSTKKEKYNKDTFYFCTITCFEWIPLFEITNLYDHIYKWFRILKSKKIYVVGFVIMPNHMHLKELVTEKYVIQKLNYIHKNPISGKYNLVDDYTLYKYSSARFYEQGRQGDFESMIIFCVN